MEIEKVAIGQTLYEPPQRRNGWREHKVISIGRKWISLDGGKRCTIDGLMLDRGVYSPERLYTSTEDYEAERKLSAAWFDLRRAIQYARLPDGLTVDAINAIRVQLGLKVSGEIK
jgi:hypothetical protein